MSTNQLPWIIFTLKKQHYAVSSELVSGIIKRPEIIQEPDMPDFLEGISDVRGTTIPVVNLRRLLKMPDAQLERDAVCEMLERRLKAHYRWFDELKRCVESGEEFTLPMEPEQCEFGQWYHGFRTDDENLTVLLRQLDEPHRKFHENARLILECRGENGELSYEGQQLMQMQELLLQKKLVKTMNEIMEQVRDERHQMILTFSRTTGDTTPCLGVSVDAVSSVDELIMVDERHNSKCLFISHYVYGVAHNHTIPGEIMLLDGQRLVELACSLELNKAEEKAEKEAEETESDKSEAPAGETEQADGNSAAE